MSKSKEYKKYYTVSEIYNSFFHVNQDNNNINQIGQYALNKTYCGNSLLILPRLPQNSVNSIITDPPFAIEHGKKQINNYNRDSENVIEGYNEIEKEDYPDFCREWIKSSYNILKKNGSIFIVSGWSNQKDILNAISESNFHLRAQIIWKHNFGVFTQKNFVSSHYNIFYCVKNPNHNTFKKGIWYLEDTLEYNDDIDIPVEIWKIKKEYWTGLVRTPNKLPKELVEMLIFVGTNQGDIILDPFGGSGTTLKVANSMNRKCLSFDINQKNVDFANYRLECLNY